LINCQQQQQQTECEVFQPSGWETGLDSSGVRTPTPLGLVSRGTKVTWTCPDSKRNIVDGKQSWVGECLENPSTPGYSVFQYSWPGSTWPECECPPRVNTCTMTGADTAVTYTMRHVFGTGSGDIPGLVITVPMPSSGDITTWRVKITWDMQTSDRRIQVTSRTKGIKLERLDFPGFQHEFKPLNSSYITNKPVTLDLGFNFLDSAIKSDPKKWHYPCIAKMECVLIQEESADLMALGMVVGASLGIVVLIGVCCGSCLWCLKHDSAYSSASRLVSAYSIRTVYDKKEMQKVRPYSAESGE